MEKSVIFASSIIDVMRDYQLHLDDDIVTRGEKLFGSEESFRDWLQKKVERWIRTWLDDASAKSLFHDGGLPDEALAEILKGFPPLTQEAFPELSKDEYIDMVKSRSGRLPKGLEKWL